MLDRLRHAIADRRTAKAMNLLGMDAFGPVCDECGGRRTSLMLDEYRDLSERRLGYPLAALPGACHCPPELALATSRAA